MEFHAWAPLFIFPTIPTARVNNLHYEKFADGSVKCIEDEIPFELPEGWAWARVRNIASVKGGKRLPKGASFSEEKTSHAYIRVTDMKNHSINITDLRYISDDIFSAIKNYTIAKDDLYVTIAGTIGVVGEVPVQQLQIVDRFQICDNFLSTIDTEKEELQKIVSLSKSKILDLAIRGKLIAQDPNDEPASVLLERIRAEKGELIKQGKLTLTTYFSKCYTLRQGMRFSLNYD